MSVHAAMPLDALKETLPQPTLPTLNRTGTLSTTLISSVLLMISAKSWAASSLVMTSMGGWWNAFEKGGEIHKTMTTISPLLSASQLWHILLQLMLMTSNPLLHDGPTNIRACAFNNNTTTFQYWIRNHFNHPEPHWYDLLLEATMVSDCWGDGDFICASSHHSP